MVDVWLTCKNGLDMVYLRFSLLIILTNWYIPFHLPTFFPILHLSLACLYSYIYSTNLKLKIFQNFSSLFLLIISLSQFLVCTTEYNPSHFQFNLFIHQATQCYNITYIYPTCTYNCSVRRICRKRMVAASVDK